ncbi:MAG: hypothetical protein GF347_04290 [Candidatus Moranbacteria bacterium]|nr:hypothetical protein [Candidatus Moranbacteria bacterium]
MKVIFYVLYIFYIFLLQFVVLPVYGLTDYGVNLIVLGFVASVLFFKLNHYYFWAGVFGLLTYFFNVYFYEAVILFYFSLPFLLNYFFRDRLNQYNFFHFLVIGAVYLFLYEFIFYFSKLLMVTREGLFGVVLKENFGYMLVNAVEAIFINCLLFCPLFYYFFKGINLLFSHNKGEFERIRF